eukprot:g23910.t1
MHHVLPRFTDRVHTERPRGRVRVLAFVFVPVCTFVDFKRDYWKEWVTSRVKEVNKLRYPGGASMQVSVEAEVHNLLTHAQVAEPALQTGLLVQATKRLKALPEGSVLLLLPFFLHACAAPFPPTRRYMAHFLENMGCVTPAYLSPPFVSALGALIRDPHPMLMAYPQRT